MWIQAKLHLEVTEGKETTETSGVIVQIDREEGRRGEKVLPGIDHKKD